MPGGGERPRVCTSVYAPTITLLARRVQEALKRGSDLVELRFDYLIRFDEDEVTRAVRRVADRCIFTCRPRAEGGRFGGSDEKRLSLLTSMAELKPAFTDIELRTIRHHPDCAEKIKGELIVSWHDFQGTPPRETLRRVRREAGALGGLAKIVTTARSLDDNLIILSLYKDERERGLIAFCMGEAGVVSRVLCPLYGSPFTYASLGGRAVAPGQLPISKLKELYEGVKRLD